MKQKLSITVEEKTLAHMQKHVQRGVYRNLSHLVEFAVTKLLEEKKTAEATK